MDIDYNTSSCVTELDKLIEKAVCRDQCGKLKNIVNLLKQPDPLEDSARPSAGPIKKEETIKVKVEELPSRILTRDESRTIEGQKVQDVAAPVVILTGKITFWNRELPKSALLYLPKYLPYQTEDSRGSNVRDWVIKQAEKPLNLLELDPGFLYVYWNRAAFGVRKIGYSTRDVGVRLGEWEQDCKHIAEEQYRSPSKVMNVRRVERLVHAELKNYRVKEYGCRGCLGNHDEWFKDVDFEFILESIKFWTNWIMKGQYEEVESRWLLKEHAKNESSELCTRLSEANIRERKEKSTTRTSQRYGLRPRAATRSSSHKSRRP